MLETGTYEDCSVEGVYATVDAAMAAWQPPPAKPTLAGLPRTVYDAATGVTQVIQPPKPPPPEGQWRRDKWGTFAFEHVLGYEATITEYELQ